MIQANWARDLPPEARGANGIRGFSLIRFTIAHDGKLLAMHLDSNTHTVSLNRAAWAAIAGVGQFPPLPAEFSGPSLEVRIRFQVNEPKAGTPAEPNQADDSPKN